MDTLTKKPYSLFPITVNFAQYLDAGEAVASYTIECVNASTGADTKASIVHADSVVSPKVTVILKNGAEGEVHRLTVKASTTFDNVFEKEIILDVKDEINARFSKRGREEFTISYDFSNCFEEGDSIASKTVTAKRLTSGADATSDVIEGVLISSPKVLVGVKGGVKGECYRLAIKIITTLTFKYQQDVLMIVN